MRTVEFGVSSTFASTGSASFAWMEPGRGAGHGRMVMGYNPCAQVMAKGSDLKRRGFCDEYHL
jgi:hypothetical protein